MSALDKPPTNGSLRALIESRKGKGYITICQLADQLPAADANPETDEQLLQMLEAEGIRLIDETDGKVFPGYDKPIVKGGGKKSW